MKGIASTALDQLDLHTLRLGAASPTLEERRDVVDPDDVRAAARGGDRRVAAEQYGRAKETARQKKKKKKKKH